MSVTITMLAARCGAATVRCGRASAAISAASASSSRNGGRWRRQPGRAASGRARARGWPTPRTRAGGAAAASRRPASRAGSRMNPASRIGSAKLMAATRLDPVADRGPRGCAGAQRGLAAAQVPGEDPQPVAAGGEHDVVGAGAAQRAADLVALGGGGRGEAVAHAALARVDVDLAARLGVDEPEVAGGDELLLARVDDLDRHHAVAGAQRAAAAPSQSRSPRKSETITTSPRWRPSAAALRERRAQRRRAGAVALALAAQLREQREQAEAALARAHDPRRRRRRRRARRAGCRAAWRRGRRPARRPRRRRPCAGRRCRRPSRPRRRARARSSARARRRARARAARAAARSRSSRCGGRRRPGEYGRIIASSVPEPVCGVRCSPGTRLSIRFITARSSERRTCGGTGPGPGLSGERSGAGGTSRGRLTAASRRARARSPRPPAAARARRRRRPRSPGASPWSSSAACRGCGRRPRACCASAVAKNWPPVSRAMSCSVSRSGGTGSVFVAPVFGSVCVSVPFWLPSATV